MKATPGVLAAFGIAPLRGRLLGPDDCLQGAAPVAVLSYSLWQQAFAGDPGLVGRTIRANGDNITVVGIMPASFEFAAPWMRTEDCQIWLPYSMDEKERKQRDSHYLCGLARLKPRRHGRRRRCRDQALSGEN